MYIDNRLTYKQLFNDINLLTERKESTKVLHI